MARHTLPRRPQIESTISTHILKRADPAMASSKRPANPNKQSHPCALRSRCDSAPPDNIPLWNPQFLEHSLKAGTRAPSFALHDADGDPVEISDRNRTGPVVLSFHAGIGCQSCHSHLAQLMAFLPEIRQFGSRWLAIGPSSNPHRAKAVRASLLVDPTARVATAFGLIVPLGAAPSGQSSHVQPADERFPHGSLLIPATYILDRRGQIVYACACLSRCKTADPTEILGVLRFLRTGEATHRPVLGE
jgi:peroxiredoxin